jgi:predicted small lipoprotein YifL
MTRKSSALILLLGALALSGCGLRGSLERPEPMWGNPGDYQAERGQPSGDTDDTSDTPDADDADEDNGGN